MFFLVFVLFIPPLYFFTAIVKNNKIVNHITKDGMHFEGPAPRPLERLKIELGPDGQIIIDKSKTYIMVCQKGQNYLFD